MMRIPWPDGKKFAFSIVDDTDRTTLENGPLVYNLLFSLGIKSTKTIWIYEGEVREDNKDIIGTSCESPEYLKWVQMLQKQGFEIALHNMSWSRTPRTKIIAGLELFKDYFGSYPKLLAQHNDILENESIYWGRNRLSFPINWIFDLMTLINPKGSSSKIYQGVNPESKYFWADVCKEKIKYVRNFIFSDINTLNACPFMPYHDRFKKYVNKWFASTEAPEVNTFKKVLSKENVDRLEKENGCCIIYTHFGSNFVQNHLLDPEFENTLRHLATRDAWFATTSEILDYIELFQSKKELSKWNRFSLEWKWVLHKMLVGGTS